jgi:hypothetical protein
MEPQKFSLSVLQEDPDFALLFKKKVENVKEDKRVLLNNAKTYTSQFQREIDEGTEKRKLLIENGRSRGMTEDEVFKSSQLFIPNKDTPIMNFLYFITREFESVDKELKLLSEQKVQQDKEFGGFTHNKDENYGAENTQDMVTYIYANVTLDTFNKLKKLKALANSDNEEEADLAMKKCRELCKKYNLEYSKLPVT